MEQINTLFETTGAHDPIVLPEELRTLYAGDLRFPAREDRPYVVGNFVSTLDGVVSFEVSGTSEDGDIGGHNEPDHFVMGLLRASADAVVVGARTLQEVGPGYLWLAENVYPAAGEIYARYRQEVLNKLAPPLNVIVSGSGAMDLQKTVFHTHAVRTLIITSPKGAELLARNGVAALTSTEMRAIEAPGGKIAPDSILKLLHGEFGVRLLLHEGGPALFGDFVVHGCVNELFLTVAPLFAGRDAKRQRPGVIAGTEYFPRTAPWLKLLSVKQSGDHLYLRYDNSRNSAR